MKINYARADIERIFLGENISPAARVVLESLIDIAMPKDLMTDFHAEVSRLLKTGDKITAIKWIRQEVGKKPELRDALKGYHPDPYSLAGAKTIAERIEAGARMPPPQATVLEDGEET